MQSPQHRWRAPTGPLIPRRAPRAEGGLALGLLCATAISVVGMHRFQAGEMASPRGWADSVVFCAVLLGILGLHELGHRTVGRRHGMRLSLPMFLPAPFFVGTLGALIAVRDRPGSRTALLEMGAAGPIAGFVAIAGAIALRMALGLPEGGGEPLARPLLWQILGWVSTGGSVPLTTADPIGYAAWVGCLVTAMNLLPFGQLDGGHVLSALFPERERQAMVGVTGLLLLLGAAWPGWWAWLAAIWLLAARRAWTVRGSSPLPRARAVAAVALGIEVLCFTPVPW